MVSNPLSETEREDWKVYLKEDSKIFVKRSWE